jgi:arylsulfatase
MSDTCVPKTDLDRRSILMSSASLLALAATRPTAAHAQSPEPAGKTAAPQAGSKPNILVLWGDDIGIANVSTYSNGLMGYETPNIDRIAKEGL